ncbi:MAG: YraN family protein [Negativicutes bacterium]|nr:YraN family protein [Negativicutes bacterium]
MGNIEFGDAGEKIAAAFLRRNGYELLTQNYRTRIGEIDIIARKSGTICFVEVKTRRNQRFGSPAEAVTYQKQRKIINTALIFLKASGNTDTPIRFDIMEVIAKSTNDAAQCRHIINAFGY